MPGKKGGKSTQSSKTSTAGIKQIWGQIDANDWLHILRTARPSTNWTYARRQIKGKCPFHDDSQASFIVDLERQQAKCWGGDCGKYYWDPVRFFKDLNEGNMTYQKALLELKDRFNIKISKHLISEVGKRQRHRDMKKLLFEVMRGELIDCVAMRKMPVPEQELFYARDAVTYLEQRGIKDMYHFLPIGVFPPKARLEKLINNRLQLMPKERAQYFKGVWEEIEAYLEVPWNDTAWMGSIAFFTGSSPNDVCKIKLRKVPHRQANMYMPQDFVKDICFIHDDNEPNNGAFGLFGVPPYWHRIGKENQTFHWVEGEFDALTMMYNQFIDGGQILTMVFAGGGSSTCGLDMMKGFRFDAGYIVGDLDDKGPAFIQKVLEQTSHLPVKVFEWPDEYKRDLQNKPLDKNDPDRAVNMRGLEKFQRELRDETNFTPPHVWCLAGASKEMSGIDSNDIRQLTNKAATWGRYVRDESEQHAYVNELSKRFGVSAGQILSEIKVGDEDEDAFIERLKGVLASRLQPMHAFRTATSHIMRVWDRQTQDIYEFAIAEKPRILATISAMSGKDPLQFVKDEVGEPAFLEVDEDEAKSTYIARSNRCADYISYAITRLSNALPADSLVRRMGAGLHCVAPTVDDPEETFRLYLVNGTALYRGDYNDLGNVVWRRMPGPCDGAIVIHAEGAIRPRKLLPFVNSEADLNQQSTIGLREMYDTLFGMISKGWVFKQHTVTSELLAAATMVIPIAACVPRQPIFILNAEASSGKSSFIGGFIGRTNLPSINVIHQAYYTDNYTVAGIRQASNHGSFCVCLDEFEDKGGNDRRSGVIRGVLQLFRGHSNEEGTTLMGTAHGVSQEFRFHCMGFVAGIRGLEDVADISRFIQIEMNKQVHRESPETALLREFGADKIQEVRRNLPLLMFQHAKAFREAYYRIVDEYREGGGLEFGKMTRSLSHFYPMMAIMAICGKDYHKFIHSYFKQHRRNLERVASLALNSDLLDDVFYTPAIRIPSLEGSRPRSVNEILNSDQPEILNQSGSGVYYDKVRKWLVVHWPAAKGELVRNKELRDKTSDLMVQYASRSPYCVPDEEARRDGVFARLHKYMGAAIFRNSYSVFDVTTIVNAATQVPKAKGREDIDMLSEYREKLSRIATPKPPVRAKKAEVSGTSSGSPPVTGESTSSDGSDDDDDDGGLNW